MKKNILKVAFVAAIAMATGIQVFNAQKSEALSEVAMANVEALATPRYEIPEREDCEPYGDLCSMIVIYPDGDWGEDIVLGMKKKPGWL